MSARKFYAIEKGIPIPPPNKGGMRVVEGEHVPWSKMEVGDSILFTKGNCHIAWRAAANARMRFGTNYCCRTVEGGVRIWRIE